jgi:hypothetical protein
MLFQQITGQPSVLYYAAKIFQDAGFSGPGEATRISVVLGLFKLAMTGVAVATVGSWGRRPLLLYGVGGIVVALVALGAVGAGALGLPEGAAAWANLGALLLYVGAYQVSACGVGWGVALDAPCGGSIGCWMLLIGCYAGGAVGWCSWGSSARCGGWWRRRAGGGGRGGGAGVHGHLPPKLRTPPTPHLFFEFSNSEF